MRGVIPAPRCAYAYNLLDNSDFTNPVNQRGQTSYTGVGYGISRWTCTSGSGMTVTLTDQGLMISSTTGMVYGQYIDLSANKHLLGKTLTFAVWLSDGTIHTTSGNIPTSLDGYLDSTQITIKGNIKFNLYKSSTNKLLIARFFTGDGATTAPITIKWAALYEGYYTAETVPPYHPKGYAAELMECQRYYKEVSVIAVSTTSDLYACNHPINMRVTPTASLVKFSPYGSNDITNMNGCSIACDKESLFYAVLPTCTAHKVGGLSLKLYAEP